MIYTYEAQHIAIKAGIQAKVDANDWNGLTQDAADLLTLESLIIQAPAPHSLTVMALADPDETAVMPTVKAMPLAGAR